MKPFKDWTLEEAQAECAAHVSDDNCAGCQLEGVTCVCKFLRLPNRWALGIPDTPKDNL